MNHHSNLQMRMLTRTTETPGTIRILNPVMKRKKLKKRGQNMLVAKSNQMPGVSNQKNQILIWVITSDNLPLMQVIDESALESIEPPEPDYAHLPARPFETKKQLQNVGLSSGGVGRGKKLTIKETEIAPLKAQIDKSDAARAYKERFGSGQKGNVLRIGQDGIARRQQKVKSNEEVDNEIDDIDSFLAELDM